MSSNVAPVPPTPSTPKVVWKALPLDRMVKDAWWQVSWLADWLTYALLAIALTFIPIGAFLDAVSFIVSFANKAHAHPMSRFLPALRNCEGSKEPKALHQKHK